MGVATSQRSSPVSSLAIEEAQGMSGSSAGRLGLFS